MTASSASFASHPTVCSSRDRTSARCSRSERDKARGSRLELASEVPLAMLRTTPIRREPNHEDAVVLDPDRIAHGPREDVPVDDGLVAVGREDVERQLDVLLDPATQRRTISSRPIQGSAKGDTE